MRARRAQPFISVSALVFSLALLGTVGSPGADAVAPGTCEPQVVVLPGLTSTSQSWVAAISDSGLVVGTSSAEDAPSTAVVWTDSDHVIDTGVGGVVLNNGNRVSATAVDVNESGLVAINRMTFNPRGRIVAQDAVLWSEQDGTTVLPAPTVRPFASLTAINDEGDVVGTVGGRGYGNISVIWSDGNRSRLPTPARLETYPEGINNEGLVVGSFYDQRPGSTTPYGGWVWQLGGESGRLAPPDGRGSAGASDVDNHGRIVGGQHFGPGDGVRTVLWRGPDAGPRRVVPLRPQDLHDSGYFAASEPGFRGFGASAYVARLRDGGDRAELPNPPDAGGTIEWNNVLAVAVGRGPSAFAPQGGVTIGGYAEDYESTSQAILWTCAQTLL